MTGLWWLGIPLAPLLAMPLMWRWRDRVAPWLWLACVPAFLAALYPPASHSMAWLWPGATWGGDDLVTRAFLGFSALLWACASLYASQSERTHPRRRRFWTFWLITLSGNLLLIIAQDGVSFYVGFTLMSLCAYGLVVHTGGAEPRQAGRLYVQLAVLGEMFLYAALLVRIHEAGGALDFEAWQTAPLGIPTAILLLLGFGIKAGFWPLHIWLPQAHPAAPAAASAILSGAMIKAGILGLWRFMPQDDPLLADWSQWLFAIGLFSAFYGVVLGILQTRAKAALAYSSISQIGYLLIILSLSWNNPGTHELWVALLALYAVHHGLAKGALFMGAGLASRHRLSVGQWFLMLIPALAIAGLPLTSGGAVKTLLKGSLTETALGNWLPLITWGSFASALVLARALWLMKQKQGDQTTVSRRLTYPWAFLCCAPLLLPWVWDEMRTAMLASLTLYDAWSIILPLVVAGALIAIALGQGWTIPRALVPLPNPAIYASLWVKRLLQWRARGLMVITLDKTQWRQRERKWNRFWQQGTVAVSAWLLCFLLLLGWVW
ncbi:complex I subunit 5 family protein [Marinimicrobium sp. ABcell2]|uniref:complex I subunit 5 family protein n=1 Tax=Marinimicrobium sp. ABcell2 TaxID=3069751 RepID=UPI0027B30B77|nr:complex I subunit 5 family protein [Marinimicrobium sp. ABcell2]MDQ2078142.1 complex I subunit 5 family protein [Marinimicrobium sp. ABcell2]